MAGVGAEERGGGGKEAGFFPELLLVDGEAREEPWDARGVVDASSKGNLVGILLRGDAYGSKEWKEGRTVGRQEATRTRWEQENDKKPRRGAGLYGHVQE